MIACRAFIMKVLTGTSRCLNGRFDAQLRSPTWRREDVGMLTSASQRFNWRTTAVRLANDGLSNLEETPRHVTCRQGKLLTKLTSLFIFLSSSRGMRFCDCHTRSKCILLVARNLTVNRRLPHLFARRVAHFPRRFGFSDGEANADTVDTTRSAADSRRFG